MEVISCALGLIIGNCLYLQRQEKQSNMLDNVIHLKRQPALFNVLILNTNDVHIHIGLLRNDIRGNTKRPLEDILVVDPGAVVH